jgi:hypothetical protein
MKDLLPILEQIAKMGKPLVIIAEDVEAKPGHPGVNSARHPERLRRHAPASVTAARPCWKTIAI